MPYNIICAVCGKQFISQHPKCITCSDECRREREKETRKRYTLSQNLKAAQNEEQIRRYKEREREFDKKLLEAEKVGMSYGQYVISQKIAEQIKSDKKKKPPMRSALSRTAKANET